MDYFTRINTIESALCEFQTDLALRFILQYHGYQLFDEGFYQHLVDEGVLPEDEDEDEDKDDWDHNYDPTDHDIEEMKTWPI